MIKSIQTKIKQVVTKTMKLSTLFHTIINNILVPIRLTQSEEEDLATALLQQQHSSPRHNDIQRNNTAEHRYHHVNYYSCVFVKEYDLEPNCAMISV